jgi:hypothetical protein
LFEESTFWRVVVIPFRHADASVVVIGIDRGNRIKRTNDGLAIPLI